MTGIDLAAALLGVLFGFLCAGRGLASAAGPAPPVSPPAPTSFEEILAPGARTHETALALMAAWIEAHPADPRTPRGILWMAQLRLADGQRERARSLFVRLRRDYPDTEWALHADKGLADLDLAARRYRAAIARYQVLAESGAPFFEYLGRMGAEQVRAERLRRGLVLGVLTGLGLLWALRFLRLGRRCWRALWPPPPEPLWVLPMLLMCAIAALVQPADEERAVLVMVLGALSILWLSGAYYRARPPARAWLPLHGLLALLQAAALLGAVVVLGGLWDKFHDTLVMGAE